LRSGGVVSEERFAYNLIFDLESDLAVTFYAMNRVRARLRNADAGRYVNELLLAAVWTDNG
jgi:hypothetical protein